MPRPPLGQLDASVDERLARSSTVNARLGGFARPRCSRHGAGCRGHGAGGGADENVPRQQCALADSDDEQPVQRHGDKRRVVAESDSDDEDSLLVAAAAAAAAAMAAMAAADASIKAGPMPGKADDDDDEYDSQRDDPYDTYDAEPSENGARRRRKKRPPPPGSSNNSGDVTPAEPESVATGGMADEEYQEWHGLLELQDKLWKALKAEKPADPLGFLEGEVAAARARRAKLAKALAAIPYAPDAGLKARGQGIDRNKRAPFLRTSPPRGCRERRGGGD